MRIRSLIAVVICGFLVSGCLERLAGKSEASPPEPASAKTEESDETQSTTPVETQVKESAETVQPPATATDGRPEYGVAEAEEDSETKPEGATSEIAARYLAYQTAFYVATGFPAANPEYGPLAETTTGPFTAQIQRAVRGFRQNGRVLVEGGVVQSTHTLTFPPDVQTAKEEGNQVAFHDCFVDGTVARLEDGSLIDDQVFTFVLAIEMKVVGGAWRVSNQEIAKQWDGVNSCASFF